MITWLKERQVSIPVHHVSNSAGIVDLPEYNKDIVRAGIILYGLWPSDEVNKENIDLQPLLSLDVYKRQAQMLANQHIMRTIENIDHCGWDNLLQESSVENQKNGK